MMDKGINVTLGTDGTASNNNLNMFEEMHLAEIMHDGYHNDPTLISTQEVSIWRRSTAQNCRPRRHRRAGCRQKG